MLCSICHKRTDGMFLSPGSRSNICGECAKARGLNEVPTPAAEPAKSKKPRSKRSIAK